MSMIVTRGYGAETAGGTVLTLPLTIAVSMPADIALEAESVVSVGVAVGGQECSVALTPTLEVAIAYEDLASADIEVECG